jgi:hypothetical protein
MNDTARCLGYPADSSRAARERAREATSGRDLRWTGQAQPGWAPPPLVIIDIDKFNPDDHMKSESPLIYHVYNNNKMKSFQNYLPFFYKIYNISVMKMYQLSTKIGGIVRGVFTDTLIFKGKIYKPK